MEGTTEVLIVGAGLAGLAAGRDLARAGLKVQVLDKLRGVSGRAATRWLELDGKNVRVDQGTKYFTAKRPVAHPDSRSGKAWYGARVDAGLSSLEQTWD